MRYSCKKTVTYKNAKVLYDNIKPTFHLSKTPKVRIYPTRIRLVTAHATLTYATLNNKGTARLRKKRASYSDRLASSSRNHNIEENVRSRVFANKANKEG
jgi:hypothetical protein